MDGVREFVVGQLATQLALHFRHHGFGLRAAFGKPLADFGRDAFDLKAFAGLLGLVSKAVKTFDQFVAIDFRPIADCVVHD